VAAAVEILVVAVIAALPDSHLCPAVDLVDWFDGAGLGRQLVGRRTA